MAKITKTTHNKKTVTLQPKKQHKKPDQKREADTVRRCLYCGKPL